MYVFAPTFDLRPLILKLVEEVGGNAKTSMIVAACLGDTYKDTKLNFINEPLFH